jgi:translation initiation factor IF-3
MTFEFGCRTIQRKKNNNKFQFHADVKELKFYISSNDSDFKCSPIRVNKFHKFHKFGFNIRVKKIFFFLNLSCSK